MPTANMMTMDATATANSCQPLRSKRLRSQPKAIATKVNRMEMVPAQPEA